MSFHFDHWEIDDISQSKKKKKKHNVRYSNSCSIILIPCRQEYQDAGIDLWYSKRDQADAQYELIEEVNKVLEINPNLSLNLAMTYLYQPRYDMNNIENVDHSISKLDSHDQSEVNLFIVNESVLEYEKAITSISNGLDSSFYPQFKHFKSIEDIINTIDISDKKLNSREQSTTIILIDQSVICSYDLWSISVFLPINSLYKLRKYYNKLLVGLCLTDFSNDTIKRKNIDNVVDFIWIKPIDHNNNIDMLNILLKTNIQQKEYNLYIPNTYKLKTIKSFDSHDTNTNENNDIDTNDMQQNIPSNQTLREVSGSPLETYLKYLS